MPPKAVGVDGIEVDVHQTFTAAADAANSRCFLLSFAQPAYSVSWH